MTDCLMAPSCKENICLPFCSPQRLQLVSSMRQSEEGHLTEIINHQAPQLASCKLLTSILVADCMRLYNADVESITSSFCTMHHQTGIQLFYRQHGSSLQDFGFCECLIMAYIERSCLLLRALGLRCFFETYNPGLLGCSQFGKQIYFP